jgi:DNA-binding transcriptional LysR family regulator
MPPVLAAFAARHEDAAVTLFDIPVARIAEKVQSGGAEFGVTIVSAHLRKLRIHEHFDEPYVLLVPEAHPLAERPAVARADLDGVTMARISTQSKNRQLVDDALGEVRDRVRWRFEVQNAAMAIRLVARGAAVTILPRSVAEFVPGGVAVRPFVDIRPSRTIGIVRRRGVPLSDLGAALMERVEAELERHAEEVRSGAPHPALQD